MVSFAFWITGLVPLDLILEPKLYWVANRTARGEQLPVKSYSNKPRQCFSLDLALALAFKVIQADKNRTCCGIVVDRRKMQTTLRREQTYVWQRRTKNGF